MTIELVAAVDTNGALGKHGTMAWHVPQELRHFKQLTLGGVVIMGRVTFASLGKPLPGRVNLVVSRQPPNESHADTVWATSIAHALDVAARQYPDKPIWIGGGAKIYSQTLGMASRVHLSRMPVTIEGADAFFPPLHPAQWTCISEQKVLDDASGQWLFTYQQYERRQQSESEQEHA